MKTIIKKIVPGFIIKLITGLFYGWHGNYRTWAEAKNRCTGYDSSIILEKVIESALKVKNGQAEFERDSVTFANPEYSYQLLSSLLWAASLNNGKLNVMDFGGSLGSTYFQNIKVLSHLENLNWCIIEQKNYTEAGKTHFSDESLHFFESIAECVNSYKINVILLSSVLQYIEKPFALLNELIAIKPEFIIIDRTPFIEEPDRITIQKVHPKIYKATYPCWFFNKKKFIDYISQQYELIFEFDAFDRANIKSQFKGFLFKLGEKL